MTAKIEKKQNKNERQWVGVSQIVYWSHSVAVSTTDFESVNPGSNPGET
jgi:hypothetical protein